MLCIFLTGEGELCRDRDALEALLCDPLELLPEDDEFKLDELDC